VAPPRNPDERPGASRATATGGALSELFASGRSQTYLAIAAGPSSARSHRHADRRQGAVTIVRPPRRGLLEVEIKTGRSIRSASTSHPVGQRRGRRDRGLGARPAVMLHAWKLDMMRRGHRGAVRPNSRPIGDAAARPIAEMQLRKGHRVQVARARIELRRWTMISRDGRPRRRSRPM